MTTHELKSRSSHFRLVWGGIKTFEIRRNDRHFVIGDTLRLREWDPETGYTGLEIVRRVIYITDFEQQPGFVVMGIAA